jgi:hypothetical protein
MGLSEMISAAKARLDHTRRTYKYSALPDPEVSTGRPSAGKQSNSLWQRQNRSLLKFTMAAMGLALVIYVVAVFR